MKQIQIWPNHVAVPHLDLVLVRPAGEPLGTTLARLGRMGLDIGRENIELHEPGSPLALDAA